MSNRILLGAALLAIAACAREKVPTPDTARTVTQAGDVTSARQMIDSVNKTFGAALVKNDTATIAGFYAANAKLMLEQSAMMSGRAQIVTGLGSYLASIKLTDATVTTEDVIVGGDLLVETGHYDWAIEEKGGKTRHDTGKYLTVWQRQTDGGYKILFDAPTSEPAPAKK